MNHEPIRVGDSASAESLSRGPSAGRRPSGGADLCTSPGVAAAAGVKVRALRQIEQGKVEQALTTLRLGYELSDKVAREPMKLSGLVSLAMTADMNDCLAQLMNRPDAPNLYWALAESPCRQPIFRRALDGRRMWSADRFHTAARMKAGEALSADQWRSAFDYGLLLTRLAGHERKLDPVRDASLEARDHGAATGAKRLVLSTAATNREARALYKTYRYEQDDVFVVYSLEL